MVRWPLGGSETCASSHPPWTRARKLERKSFDVACMECEHPHSRIQVPFAFRRVVHPVWMRPNAVQREQEHGSTFGALDKRLEQFILIETSRVRALNLFTGRGNMLWTSGFSTWIQTRDFKVAKSFHVWCSGQKVLTSTTPYTYVFPRTVNWPVQTGIVFPVPRSFADPNKNPQQREQLIVIETSRVRALNSFTGCQLGLGYMLGA